MLLFVVGFFTCLKLPAQRVFYFQSDSFSRGELEEIKLSPADYDIYVRQICIRAKSQHFSDCPIGSLPDSLTRVEVQYLLKSKTGNRVVYISNYPDQFEELLASKLFDIDSGRVNLNPWYFSKFYIGEYDEASGQILFRRSASKTLGINCSLSQDSLFFDRLTITENDDPEIMDMNEALAPGSRFVKQRSFRWFFKDNEDSEEGIPLRDDILYVSRKTALKGVFFRLSRPWKDRYCCYIYYKYARLMTPLF